MAEDDDEEEGAGENKISFAPLAVFCTFFVAELGDKTQLTAITFGANEGISSALVVWIGCSIGLFAADILGMLVGKLIQNKASESVLHTLAFVIFAVFGVFTLFQGVSLMVPDNKVMIASITAAGAVIFAVICLVIFMRKKVD